MENIIKRYENIALSDKEVLDIVKNRANIVLYPNIYKYDSIDELLGENNAAIILFESEPNFGHWVLVFRENDNLEFFNSYGGYPDDSLKHIDKQFRKKTHQDKPYLSYLFMKSPYNLHFNNYKFQKHKSNIKTCGRHAAIRLLFKNLNIDEYKNMLDGFIKYIGGDYDKIVTLLTMYANK